MFLARVEIYHSNAIYEGLFCADKAFGLSRPDLFLNDLSIDCFIISNILIDLVDQFELISDLLIVKFHSEREAICKLLLVRDFLSF